MNSIYNDSLIAELKEFTARENVCANNLLSVCNKIKNKVFDMVNQNEDLLSSLRYAMHLRGELIRRKELMCKKKQRNSFRIG